MNSLDASSAVVIFIVLVVGVLVVSACALLMKRSDKEKGSIDGEKRELPASPSLPKPDEDEKVPKKIEATRVVTSIAFREGKVDKGKSKSPSEAEFMQLLAWKSSGPGLKTCSCCGAEMGLSVSICPACGQTN